MRLMRLNHWQPLVLILTPTLVSCGMQKAPFSIYFFAVIAALIVRSAGCIFNDLCDVRFDAQIGRTCARPLVSGEVSFFLAWMAIGVLAVLGCVLLCFFLEFMYLAFCVVLGVILYCFAKRFSYMTHLFLGATISLGVFLPSAHSMQSVHLGHLLLYIGGVFWASTYDLAYAQQDRAHDLWLDLKGLHLLLPRKRAHVYCTCIILTVFLWSLAGVIFKSHGIFYVCGACSIYPIRTLLLSEYLAANPLQPLRFRETAFWALGWFATACVA